MRPHSQRIFSKAKIRVFFCCQNVQHRLHRGPEKSVVQKYLPSVLIYFGEVTEWLKVHAWNACVRKYREFESHPLRQSEFKCDSRVLRNRESQTPSGPGGSSGSEPPRVLQGCPAIFFLRFSTPVFFCIVSFRYFPVCTYTH